MAAQSKIRQYKDNEVNLDSLANQAHDVLGKRPFKWQLEAADTVLTGNDVILDVGTGCGKSLCFSLPLLPNDTDIAVTVAPLTALMLDQANSSALSTVAVCQQTIMKVGREKLYADIINRKFRQVIVSPEIAISKEFLREILTKNSFTEHVRVLNIDEAHCCNIWGGSFRPDYAQLGMLRGRFQGHVAMQVVSATLPDHILDDVKSKLRLAKDVKTIRVTNERPNIALSVRPMEHSEESKADLRFLIPPDAEKAEDIPITLVYCNKRKDTEECADRTRDWAEEQGIPRECIAFYHALIGEDRKRDIEGELARDLLRILYATEALGMGCDLRNVKRVVLWGLPPTFCALVQRVGRAGRNLELDAEAIVIVPKSVLKDGVTEPIVVEDAVVDDDGAAELIDSDPVPVDQEGVRVEAEAEADNQMDIDVEAGTSVTPGSKKGKHRVAVFSGDTNIHETRAVLDFVRTTACRWVPWNRFFKNGEKLQLVYGETTMYKPRPNRRCCDNCQPERFPIEKVTATRVNKGMKRGKKKNVLEEESGYIRNKLHAWRETILMDAYYGELDSLPSSTVMPDSVIEKISTCGERIRDYGQLCGHVRWPVGQDLDQKGPNKYGGMLMEKLAEIYKVLDENDERQKAVKEQEAIEEAQRAQQAAYEANLAKPFKPPTMAELNINSMEEVGEEEGIWRRDYQIHGLRFEIQTPEDY